MAKKAPTAKPKPKAKPPAKGTAWTVESVLTKLASLGNATLRAQNAKRGAGDNQSGVKLGDVRTLANAIKTNHELALALWKTGHLEAQFLAVLLMESARLTADDLERLVTTTTYAWVADWLYSYVIKVHADKDALRVKWMASAERWTARAGWQLTAGRVAKNSDGLDLVALLDRIEAQLATAGPEVQWTMNMCLAEIGIHHPKHRKRAVAIGETLGVYRDYPCSKGCTSPFAPIWIDAMVKRQR